MSSVAGYNGIVETDQLYRWGSGDYGVGPFWAGANAPKFHGLIVDASGNEHLKWLRTKSRIFLWSA